MRFPSLPPSPFGAGRASLTPEARRERRWGLAAASIWLVYLFPAAGQVVGDDGWPAWQRVLGGIALVSFVVLYVTTIRAGVGALRQRAPSDGSRQCAQDGASGHEVVLRTSALVGLALTTSIAFGGPWITTIAYVAAVLAVILPTRRVPAAVVLCVAVAEGLLVLRVHPWSSDVALWLAFGVLVAGFVTLGFRRRQTLLSDLALSREDVARLAVTEERLRIARDLHDLLGHSLSVIAVKSQLAERLLERDATTRARDEIRDVRGVARDALHEVRHVIEGYRRRPLSAEMAAAEAALRADDVEVVTELPAEPIPDAIEDVAAFIVREGSTNVLRHARARHCRLSVRRVDGAVVATVSDDGLGIPQLDAPRTVSPDRPDGSSHGLLGLAERLLPVDGELHLAPGDAGGTVLEARIPLPGAATSPAEELAAPAADRPRRSPAQHQAQAHR